MSNNKIAILAEGTSEKAILDVLLDNDLLIFTREELIDEEVLSIRKASDFERQYLNHSFENKIKIYRVHDSRTEAFNLRKEYKLKVEDPIYEIYTTPEIEVLFLIYKGDYEKYIKGTKKSNIKPSKYVKQNYGKEFKNFKTYKFVYHFWSNDVNELVKCIQEYARMTSNDYSNTICSLLK